MRIFLSVLLLLGAPLLAAASEVPAIEPGARLNAKGQWVGENRFEARSLSLRDAADDDFEIAGSVSEVDGETGAFRIAAIWILLDEEELDRRTRRVARRFEPGDWVKVEGEFDAEGRLVADSLERLKRDDARTSIEGIVAAVQPAPDGTERVRIGPVAVTWATDAPVKDRR